MLIHAASRYSVIQIEVPDIVDDRDMPTADELEADERARAKQFKRRAPNSDGYTRIPGWTFNPDDPF